MKAVLPLVGRLSTASDGCTNIHHWKVSIHATCVVNASWASCQRHKFGYINESYQGNLSLSWEDAGACNSLLLSIPHDVVMKWKIFPRYWPFVQGIHQSPVNSPQKGTVTRGLMFFMLVRANSEINRRVAGDLRRHGAHSNVIVMMYEKLSHMDVIRMHEANRYIVRMVQNMQCLPLFHDLTLKYR